MTLDDLLPDPPEVTDELLNRCRATGDFREVLFLYYQNVAILSTICGNLQFESPSWGAKSKLRWVVLVGLLTRVQRIMAGHLEFFQDDRYGDLTLILDRCLLETCVKIRWISLDLTERRLHRYIEDSLRADSELLEQINSNIASRNGRVLKIEARMLRSIKANAVAAGFDVTDLPNMRKAPPLADMVRDIGEHRYMYNVVGKIGSHAVHGTWANLLYCYLDGDPSASLEPRVNFPPPHINQYAMNCFFVLQACKDFVASNFQDSDDMEKLLAVIDYHSDEIMEIYSEAIGDDFHEE